MIEKNRYYIVYKPFGTICQFSSDGNKPTLAQLHAFESDIYPVGRLDTDSEGLLILTNDKTLNNKLLNPKFKHRRTYLAHVEGTVTNDSLLLLCKGVTITVDGKPYQTLPAKAAILTNEPSLPDRLPPIRYRKNIPTSWIELSLCEGKNRQVRKMTAAVGFPTLRLVRKSIVGIEIGTMQSGDVLELTRTEIYNLLFTKTK